MKNCVVDVARGFVARTISLGTDLVADFVLSPDGRRVYASLADAGTVAILDVDRGEVVDRIGIGGELGAVGLTADGESLFVAVNSGPRIAVISTASRRVVDGFALEPVGDPENVWIGIALAPDGSRVLANTIEGLGDDAHVELIDTRSRETTAPRSDRRLDGVVQISADGASAYVGSFSEGAVFVLSMNTGQLLVEIPVDPDAGVLDLGIGADGGLLFAGLICFGCDDGVVAVIDGNTNVVRGRLAVGLEPGAFGVASAPCGSIAPPTAPPTPAPRPTATPCTTNCVNPGGVGDRRPAAVARQSQQGDVPCRLRPTHRGFICRR